MSAVITSDETLVIETPERVPLHFALASIGNRFIACAIDHTIQQAIAYGERSAQEVSDAFNDAAHLAIYDEPREELIANWRECRDAFAPPDLRS